MSPDKIQFLCGLVAGGCLFAALWLRWDLVERAAAWLERWLRG